jgi:hypothetical protein
LVALALVWINSVVLVMDLYRNATFGFLGGLAVQLALLGIFGFLATGVVRRSRSIFVLLLIGFVVGGLSAATSLIGIMNYQRNLELLLGTADPSIAAFAQSQVRAALPSVVIGCSALGAGALMLVGWRKRGVWGAFWTGSRTLR